MESYPKSSNWKILLALLVILFLIVMALMIFSRSSVSILPQKSPSPDITGSKLDSNGWQTVSEPEFKISYPPSVSVSKAQVVGGGMSLTFKPKDKLNYNLQMQVLPSSIADVEKIANGFRSFKYSESDIMVGIASAKKFSGALNLSSQTLQETVVIFEHQGQIFELQVSYRAQDKIQEVEDLFYEILKTLIIN